MRPPVPSSAVESLASAGDGVGGTPPGLRSTRPHVLVRPPFCPLVTSDQTPWTSLQRSGIGWDLPLDDERAWHEALDACVAMDDAGFREASHKASQFARQIGAADIAAEHRLLFDSILDPALADGAARANQRAAAAAR